VLLLHGLSSSAEGWWRLGPDLAGLGLAVTAPDLRGHGASPEGDGFAVTDYRDDVLDLGTEWDLVIGHSLGGAVAVACQAVDPGFAQAVVLVDPALRLMASTAVLAGLLAEYDTATEATLTASRPRWAPEDVQSKVRALAAAGPHVAEATYRALATVDGWPDVAALAIPTLIIGADPMGGDALVSELDGRRAERNRSVRYVAIPESSHSVHRDSYPAFWDELREFLGDLDLVAGLD
jgi:3-oxoadipate enol-lactonase